MKNMFPLLLVGTIFLSGCSFAVPDHAIPQETTQYTIAPSSNDSILISIENAEGTVGLMVEENDHFAGAKAEITGETVTQTGGQIIQSNHNVADWGGNPEGAYFFDGSYNITGPELLQTRFRFSPTQPQNYDMLSCGVNFYDLIMEVEGYTYSGASVLYQREMQATGAEGTISFLVFPLSKEMKDAYGVNQVTISCTVATACDISLTWSGSCFIIEATSTITDCMIITEDGSNAFITYASAPASKYEITVQGEPKISSAD